MLETSGMGLNLFPPKLAFRCGMFFCVLQILFLLFKTCWVTFYLDHPVVSEPSCMVCLIVKNTRTFSCASESHTTYLQTVSRLAKWLCLPPPPPSVCVWGDSGYCVCRALLEPVSNCAAAVHGRVRTDSTQAAASRFVPNPVRACNYTAE